MRCQSELVLVAGKQSHGPGQHEHRAGTMLAEKCLDAAFETGAKGPQLVTATYTSGWPTDPTAFDNADAIFFFAFRSGTFQKLFPDILIDWCIKERGINIHFAYC